MFARLRGELVAVDGNCILLEVGGITYEIRVPLSVLNEAQHKRMRSAEGPGDQLEVFTYCYIEMPAAGNARPRLVGFMSEMEREFFELLMSAPDIGTKRATDCLDAPMSELATAIETGDTRFLSKAIKGVGPRTAEQMVAALRGKCARYALIRDTGLPPVAPAEEPEAAQQARAALRKLGYTEQESDDMVRAALRARPELTTWQDILDEAYRQTAQIQGD